MGTATAAFMLTGMTLPGGWRVRELVKRPPTATGGHFSVGYIAQKEDGTEAFVKALDYSSALAQQDPARALEAMTAAFNFERDILRSCREKGMSRIIRILGDGKIEVAGAVGVPVVNYLLLEKADGDIRAYLDAATQFDLAWALRTLHNVATALMQMHLHGMAHQDVKPSNVLVQAGSLSKLSDLGRASYRGHVSPFDDLMVVGDLSYAPPELLYGQRDSEWSIRCAACDMYLLGSLMTFLFNGMAMTPLIFSHMNPAHCPGNWNGDYGQVLPYVREAFDRVVRGFELSLPPALSEELTPLIRYMCDPAPDRRGHPRTRAGRGNPRSLERFVSRFDLLATRAERGLMEMVT